MKGSRAQQQLDELFRFDKVQELRCDEVRAYPVSFAL